MGGVFLSMAMSYHEAEDLANQVSEAISNYATHAYSDDGGESTRDKGILRRDYPTLEVSVGEDGYRVSVLFQQMKKKVDPGLMKVIEDVAGSNADIEYIGAIKAFKGRTVKPSGFGSTRPMRARPLRDGISVSNFRARQSGTLGCFVQAQGQKDLMILSNAHILATGKNAQNGDIVIQPGRCDGGIVKRDGIGSLAQYIELHEWGNKVDAALARIENSEFIPDDLREVSVRALRTGPELTSITVQKIGKASGATKGKVLGLTTTPLTAEFGRGVFRSFDVAVRITGMGNLFAKEGDSGSLIRDDEGNAIALLFGGNKFTNMTFAIPIITVMETFRTEFNLELTLLR
jgi:hypothetical protein